MHIVAPKRRSHSCVQTWNATPDRVFPLLCPVRETDWIPGWDPKLVVSGSGVMEQDCLFIEPAEPADAIWLVTRYEKDRCLEMYRVLPGVTVSKFSILLEPLQDSATRAVVTYEHTAVGDEGEQVVDAFTPESHAAFMAHFGAAMNHYLATGRMLEELPRA